MSGVPSPAERKPKPRMRLNHFTSSRSSLLVGSTLTWVRGGGICAGWRAVEFVHREDAEGLETTGTVQRFADDARALVGGLVAVAAKAGHVQQNIGPAIVGNDEAKALADVEPLDGADDLDDIETGSSAPSTDEFPLDRRRPAPRGLPHRLETLPPCPQRLLVHAPPQARYATDPRHLGRFTNES